MYEIEAFTDENILSFQRWEDKFVEENLPYMIFCKINSDNIKKIHFLESVGFNYIETQFHMAKRLKELYEMRRKIQYSLADDKDICKILNIAYTIFDTDRYSIDPYIGKDISGKRYVNWIMSSLGEENYYLYKYTYDNDIVGFHMIKLENKKAYALLGGVNPDYKGIGIGLEISLLLNNILYSLGIKEIDTHISAINTNIFNIYMFMKYQIKDVKTVLRKIY